MTAKSEGDRLVMLGSGGARIVVAKQMRASGGVWFSLAGTRFLVDPGPGALVRMTGSRHRLSPTKLAGILLSHRHLDHSGDVNNMVEAMTMGGTEPRGSLFAPADALEGDDPVVFKYLRSFLERVVTLEAGGTYELNGVRFSCPVRHQHRGEVYGFRFEVKGQRVSITSQGDPTAGRGDSLLTVSYVADTKYFPELADCYRADVVVMNVVRPTWSELDHLSAPEAEELVRAMRPRLTVLSHFGMKMLAAKPWVLAREISQRTGCQVIAASDGMLIDLDEVKVASPKSEVGAGGLKLGA